MSLDLDKSTWKRVAFGDVVRNLNVTVKDPSAEGIDQVIAMEHLDPGELKISRWGSIEDGTTFTRRVKPGQTLFGKRRAYQRKAAYAEFDAITSGDILVFEADPTQLLPEFLPFLVQSDGFYDHALGTSAGSLSPRTNWRDLSNYEFDLPPLDQQQHLADLLWALERHRLATTQRSDAASSLRSTLVRERLADGTKAEVPLRTLIRPGTSITYGIVQAGPEVEDGVPYIRVSDMTDGVLSVRGMKRTSPEIAERFERSRVESGDLVVALRGRTGLTLRVPSELDGANLTQGTARVAVDDAQVDPDYVLTIMNSDWMSRKIGKQAKGSTFTELTLAALRGLPIPRLGRTGEAALLAELTALDGATCASSEDLDSLGELRRSLLNNVFGGAE
ncbi:restriction endonuclease subunit S [Streptomyces sp. NPDC012510]|uniref:restriction endonuclease subunit S n=1 Tax=Streptomyces sp. NPDC012510 TaxID=3364838 RepID=UPI0036EDC36C